MNEYEIAIVLGLLFGIPALILAFATWSRRYKLEHQKYNPKTDDVIRASLAEFQYFQALSKPAQIQFIKRIRFIASDKEFVGKKGLEVTDDMRVKISAAIVQITFGLDEYKLLNFNKIFIYPDIFYSSLVKNNVKGLTGRGAISISWPDFVDGYADPNDNYNLGLHEVAHALHLSTTSKSGDLEIFGEYFEYWRTESNDSFEALKQGESTFLRTYGATNFHEFFAVCIEHFFESPNEFKLQEPILYERTVLLLSQDPLEDRNDYRPNISPNVRKKLKELFGARAKRFQRKSLDVKLIFLGVFVGTFLLNILTEQMAFNYIDKTIALAFLALPPLALFRWFKERGYFEYFLIYAFFSLFGFAMNFMAILLTLNQILPAQHTIETHKVVGFEYFDSHNHVVLENDAYGAYPYLREFAKTSQGVPSNITFDVRKGFLQIPELSIRLIEYEPEFD